MTGQLRLLVPALALLLAGCATVDIDQAVRDTNTELPAFTGGQLQLARGGEQERERQALAASLLAEPLSMEGAVRLALANSPAVQALLARGWADMAAAAQAGRPANPVFRFERMRLGDELEIGRLLSIGLLDLLTLPQRQAIARNQLAQGRVQLAGAVVEQVGQVRQAWVRAVAAQQLLAYAQQVNRAAQASAELARRMEQAGNFNKLERARQHAFYADAAARLASATHAATAAREELVRQLGLDDAQARALRLPERLPDLPKEARGPAELRAAAMEQRLDVRLAALELAAAGKSQGLDLLHTLVDVEAGVRRDTVFDNATGQRGTRRGFELDLRLPLFDWGGAQRAALDAHTLLAANRYQATLRAASSQLRESYSAYRTALDLARHYRDEVVPLHQVIAEQNALRYSGMLIGVFELLAETREQIATVMAAIDAQQQFWLADAALAAALVGKP